MNQYQIDLLCALYLVDPGSAMALKEKPRKIAATLLGAELVHRIVDPEGKSYWTITPKGSAVVEAIHAREKGQDQ